MPYRDDTADTESKALVLEAFTELAPRYAETVDRELRQFWGLSYKDFIHRLLGAAPTAEGGLILDVATGSAQIPLTLALAPFDGSTVVGLDITPAMLQAGLANVEARGLASRVRLVCASAMQMPLATGVFDLAICGLATHHMHVPRLLSETQRILKPGGHLVMADVAAPAHWRSRAGSGLIQIAARLYSLTHRSARTRAEIAAISNILTSAEWLKTLAELGFVEIEVVAELKGRRLLYPGAILFRAVKKAS